MFSSFGRSIDTAQQLLLQHLRIQYDAELRLIEALPRYADAAAAPELGDFLRQHLGECHRQAGRLADVFHRLGSAPERETSSGMKGILVDIAAVTAGFGDAALRDAALVMAVQHAEHHEMAGFRNLGLLAHAIGRDDVATLFRECLEEVAAANERLAALIEPALSAPPADG